MPKTTRSTKSEPLNHREVKAIVDAIKQVIRDNKTKHSYDTFESAYFKMCDLLKIKERAVSKKRAESLKESKKAPKKFPTKKSKETIYDRLQNLKFYCPGDEAGELFQATCDLCYKMSGLGDPEKAELLYTWAVEQADHSKTWAEEQGYGLNDFIHGM